MTNFDIMEFTEKLDFYVRGRFHKNDFRFKVGGGLQKRGNGVYNPGGTL